MLLPSAFRTSVTNSASISPSAARAWDLSEENPCVFELDLDALAALKPKPARFKAPTPFPGSQRDLSFFVDRKISYAALRGAVSDLRLAVLRGMELALAVTVVAINIAVYAYVRCHTAAPRLDH